MKTKLEIIEETVKFYSEKPSRRSLNSSGSCKYHGPNGKRCAFSRCCRSDVDLSKFENSWAGFVLARKGEKILKPNYRGHEPDFWEDVQRIHDADGNWNKSGLTEDGKIFVRIFKERYLND